MNNQTIEREINDCISEFSQLDVLVTQVGAMSPMSKYLTLYSLIKACGVIEYSYKNLIADYHNTASPQVQKYVDLNVRSNSKNPSLDNIRKLLKSFDDNWNTSFGQQLDAHPDSQRIKQSLSSLNDNRNSFAHGHGCTASFSDIKQYFLDAVEIIKIIDTIVV